MSLTDCPDCKKKVWLFVYHDTETIELFDDYDTRNVGSAADRDLTVVCSPAGHCMTRPIERLDALGYEVIDTRF